MVAQEVEQFFPDWVGKDVHGYKTLTFRGFEALAVEALRELRVEKNTEIAELKKENESLNTRLAAVEAVVTKLAEQQEGAGQ